MHCFRMDSNVTAIALLLRLTIISTGDHAKTCQGNPILSFAPVCDFLNLAVYTILLIVRDLYYVIRKFSFFMLHFFGILASKSLRTVAGCFDFIRFVEYLKKSCIEKCIDKNFY